MSMRPLHDRILVKRSEGEECTESGIILPDSAVERPDEGMVIEVGNGRQLDTGQIMPLDVMAGDKVLFGKYCGHEVDIAGEEYLIMREDDILAIIGD